MADAFLMKSPPDSLFPCETNEIARRVMLEFSHNAPRPPSANWMAPCPTALVVPRDGVMLHCEMVLSDENSAYDAMGRCKLQCANGNCRMLFNQLECVKADLETTKKALQVTATELHSTKEILQVTANELVESTEELHSVKCALEECKKERNEEKRKFASAITKMVQSEMSALNMFLKRIG